MPAWIISGQGRGGYVQEAGRNEDAGTAEAANLKR